MLDKAVKAIFCAFGLLALAACDTTASDVKACQEAGYALGTVAHDDCVAERERAASYRRDAALQRWRSGPGGRWGPGGR